MSKYRTANSFGISGEGRADSILGCAFQRARQNTALTPLMPFTPMTLALILAACGGGGGGGGGPTATTTSVDMTTRTVKGRLYDGPISGAKIYIDINNDGVIDDEDIEVTTTGFDGTYNHTITIATEHAEKDLIADLRNATDQGDPDDDQDNRDLTSGVLRADHDAEVISPLTHYLVVKGDVEELGFTEDQVKTIDPFNTPKADRTDTEKSIIETAEAIFDTVKDIEDADTDTAKSNLEIAVKTAINAKGNTAPTKMDVIDDNGATIASATIAEDEDITKGKKLATIKFTDDDLLGTNIVGLTGTNADDFEVRDTDKKLIKELHLKADAPIDFETAQTHVVTLTGSGSGSSSPAIDPVKFTLNVTNINDNGGEVTNLTGTFAFTTSTTISGDTDTGITFTFTDADNQAPDLDHFTIGGTTQGTKFKVVHDSGSTYKIQAKDTATINAEDAFTLSVTYDDAVHSESTATLSTPITISLPAIETNTLTKGHADSATGDPQTDNKGTQQNTSDDVIYFTIAENTDLTGNGNTDERKITDALTDETGVTATLTITDQDGATIASADAPFELDATTNALVWKPTDHATDFETTKTYKISIRFSKTDKTKADSSPIEFELRITDANDAPIIVDENKSVALTIKAGESSVGTKVTDEFSDPDAGEAALGYERASQWPDGITLNGSTGVITVGSGVMAKDYELYIWARDDDTDHSKAKLFTITVTAPDTTPAPTPTNAPPTLTATALAGTGTEETASITPGAGTITFADSDTSDTLASLTINAAAASSDASASTAQTAVEDVAKITALTPTDVTAGDTTIAGTYGDWTISRNDTTGAITWSFAPNTAAQALDTGETQYETLGLYVNDGEANSPVRVITVTLNGAEDAATFSKTDTQTATLDSDDEGAASTGTDLGHRFIVTDSDGEDDIVTLPTVHAVSYTPSGGTETTGDTTDFTFTAKTDNDDTTKTWGLHLADGVTLAGGTYEVTARLGADTNSDQTFTIKVDALPTPSKGGSQTAVINDAAVADATNGTLTGHKFIVTDADGDAQITANPTIAASYLEPDGTTAGTTNTSAMFELVLDAADATGNTTKTWDLRIAPNATLPAGTHTVTVSFTGLADQTFTIEIDESNTAPTHATDETSPTDLTSSTTGAADTGTALGRKYIVTDADGDDEISLNPTLKVSHTPPSGAKATLATHNFVLETADDGNRNTKTWELYLTAGNTLKSGEYEVTVTYGRIETKFTTFTVATTPPTSDKSVALIDGLDTRTTTTTSLGLTYEITDIDGEGEIETPIVKSVTVTGGTGNTNQFTLTPVTENDTTKKAWNLTIAATLGEGAYTVTIGVAGSTSLDQTFTFDVADGATPPTLTDKTIAAYDDTAAPDTFPATYNVRGAIKGDLDTEKKGLDYTPNPEDDTTKTATSWAGTLSDGTAATATTGNTAIQIGTDGSNPVNSTHQLIGTYGTLYYNANNGKYFYKANDTAINALAANAAASDIFKFTATDADTDTSEPADLTFTITGANDTPTAADTTATAVPGQIIDLTDPDLATDPDGGGALTYTIVGTVPRNQDITISGTNLTVADTVETGTYALTIGVHQGGAQVTTFTYALTVSASAPSITSKAITGYIDTPARDTFATEYNATGAKTGNLANPTTGLNYEKHAEDKADPLPASWTGTFSNNTPDTTADDTAATATAGNTAIRIGTNAGDNSPILSTHKIEGTYGTLYYNAATGDYFYAAKQSEIEPLKTGDLDDAFIFTATDSDGDPSESATLTFENRANDDAFTPDPANIENINVIAGDTRTFSASDLTFADLDVGDPNPENPLYFIILTIPAKGLLKVGSKTLQTDSPLSGNGDYVPSSSGFTLSLAEISKLSYESAEDQSGTVSFSYQVGQSNMKNGNYNTADARLKDFQGTVSITVTADEIPTLTSSAATATGTEDTASITPGTDTISFADNEDDNNTLTFYAKAASSTTSDTAAKALIDSKAKIGNTQLTFAAANNGDPLTATINGTYGNFTLTRNDNTGKITWTYTPTSTDLAENETIYETLGLYVSDSHNGTSASPIILTVTLNGSNANPTATDNSGKAERGVDTIDLAEAIAITDPDTNDTIFTFALDDTTNPIPAGITIADDSNGNATILTIDADTEIKTHALDIIASDPHGGTDSFTYTLTVTNTTIAPPTLTAKTVTGYSDTAAKDVFADAYNDADAIVGNLNTALAYTLTGEDNAKAKKWIGTNAIKYDGTAIAVTASENATHYIEGSVYQASRPTSIGRLYFNEKSGDYFYLANDEAFNKLTKTAWNDERFTFKAESDAGKTSPPAHLTFDNDGANDKPTATPKAIEIHAGQEYQFQIRDFGFADADSGAFGLKKLFIRSIPDDGELVHRGTTITQTMMDNNPNGLDVNIKQLKFISERDDTPGDIIFTYSVANHSSTERGDFESETATMTITLNVALPRTDTPPTLTASDGANARIGYTDTSALNTIPDAYDDDDAVIGNLSTHITYNEADSNNGGEDKNALATWNGYVGTDTTTAATATDNTTRMVVHNDGSADIHSTHKIEGTHGTLYYNAMTGHYFYKSATDTINALTADAADQFTFTATDGDDETSAAHITLTITNKGVQDIPTATPATDIAFTAGTTYTFTEANFGFADIDDTNDTLASVTITSLSTDGTLQNNGVDIVIGNDNATIMLANIMAGHLTLVTVADDTALLTFMYTVNDGTANSAATTMSITPTAPNAAPVISRASAAVTATITLDAPENAATIATGLTATDANSDALTWGALSGADAGLFTLSSDGATLSWKNTPDFETTESADNDRVFEVTISVSDGTATTTADLEITLTNEEEGPATFTTTIPADTAPKVGETITITQATADPDGKTGSYSYAWQILNDDGRTWDPATNATDAHAHAIAAADVGKQFQVVITYTDGTAKSETVTKTLGTIAPARTPTPPTLSDGAATEAGFTDTAIRNNWSIFGPEESAAIQGDLATDLSYKKHDDDSTTDGAVKSWVGKRVVSGSTDVEATTNTTDIGSGTNATHRIEGVYGLLYYNEDNGKYSYTAKINAIDALSANVTDIFTFTATDKQDEESNSATLTFTHIGANDTPTLGSGFLTTARDLENAIYNASGTEDDTSIAPAADTSIPFSDFDTDNTLASLNIRAKAGSNNVKTAARNAIDSTTKIGNTDLTFTSNEATIVGTNGTWTLTRNDTDGEITWEFAPNAAAQALAADDTVFETLGLYINDGTANSTVRVLTVTLTGENDTPTADAQTGTAEAGGTAIDLSNTVTDIDRNDIHTFTITNASALHAGITIENNKDLTIAANTPAADYTINIQATDGTATTTFTYTLTVTAPVANTAPVLQRNGSDAPAADTPIAINTKENIATIATGLTVSDADNGDNHTWSLSGTDAALFDISDDGMTLNWKSGTTNLNTDGTPNYESLPNNDADGVYQVTVTASDGTDEDTASLDITLNNVQEGYTKFTYTITGDDNILNVGETITIKIKTPDPDGVADDSKYTYWWATDDANTNILNTARSIPAHGGLATYTIRPTDRGKYLHAEIAYKDKLGVDTANDDNGRIPTLETDDSINLFTNPVALNAAPVLQYKGSDAPAADTPIAINANENTGTITTGLTVTDAENGDNHTWSLSGTDAGLFTLRPSGKSLVWKSGTANLNTDGTPNYESRPDNDSDGVYHVTVTVSDGTDADTASLAITLNDINELPTVLRSIGHIVTAQQGETLDLLDFVIINADPEGDALTFTSGRGSANITLSGSQITIADDAPIGSRVVSYTISDGTSDVVAIFTINITPANDAPVSRSDQTESIKQGSSIDIATTDPDGDSLTYTIAQVALQGSEDTAITNPGFSITDTDKLTAALTTATTATQTAPYVVTVTVDDGQGATNSTTTLKYILTVTPDTPATATINSDGAIPVLNNTPADTDLGIKYIVTDTDGEADIAAAAPTLTATFSDDGGTTTRPTGSSFTLTETTDSDTDTKTWSLFISDKSTLTAGTYTITISKAGVAAPTTHTITVTPPNTAPTLTLPEGTNLNKVDSVEKQTAVITITAQDDNTPANDLIWILEGNDKDKFEVNNGVITWKNAPDFETTRSAAGNKLFWIKVKVTDIDPNNALTSETIDLRINLTNTNEGPATFTYTLTGGDKNPTVGEIVTITKLTNDPDGGVAGNYVYRWEISTDGATNWHLASGADVASTTHTIAAADVGKHFRVQVSYQDSGGNLENVPHPIGTIALARTIKQEGITAFDDNALANVPATVTTRYNDDYIILKKDGSLESVTHTELKTQTKGDFAVIATLDPDTRNFSNNNNRKLHNLDQAPDGVFTPTTATKSIAPKTSHTVALDDATLNWFIDTYNADDVVFNGLSITFLGLPELGDYTFNSRVALSKNSTRLDDKKTFLRDSKTVNVEDIEAFKTFRKPDEFIIMVAKGQLQVVSEAKLLVRLLQNETNPNAPTTAIIAVLDRTTRQIKEQIEFHDANGHAVTFFNPSYVFDVNIDDKIIDSDGYIGYGSPIIDIPANRTIDSDENQTAITTLTALDVDQVTWSIDETDKTDDHRLFEIDAKGNLTWKITPDFEQPFPTSTNTPRLYKVTVRATNSHDLYDTITLTVNLTDIDDISAANAGNQEIDIDPNAIGDDPQNDGTGNGTPLDLKYIAHHPGGEANITTNAEILFATITTTDGVGHVNGRTDFKNDFKLIKSPNDNNPDTETWQLHLAPGKSLASGDYFINVGIRFTGDPKTTDDDKFIAEQSFVIHVDTPPISASEIWEKRPVFTTNTVNTDTTKSKEVGFTYQIIDANGQDEITGTPTISVQHTPTGSNAATDGDATLFTLTEVGSDGDTNARTWDLAIAAGKTIPGGTYEITIKSDLKVADKTFTLKIDSPATSSKDIDNAKSDVTTLTPGDTDLGRKYIITDPDGEADIDKTPPRISNLQFTPTGSDPESRPSNIFTLTEDPTGGVDDQRIWSLSIASGQTLEEGTYVFEVNKDGAGVQTFTINVTLEIPPSIDTIATTAPQTHEGSPANRDDHVSYADLDVPVTVDLSTGTATFTPVSGGPEITDTLTSIEQVTGTPEDDTFTANDNGNKFTGGAGDDTFIGGEGNDIFIGGAGQDTFTGGAGDISYFGIDIFNTDRFHISDTATARSKADLITDFTDGGDLMYVGVDHIWYELIDSDTDGDTDDTIIYADAAKTKIIAILQDYTTGLDGSDTGDFMDDADANYDNIAIAVTDLDALNKTATIAQETHTGSSSSMQDHISYAGLAVSVTVNLSTNPATAKFTPASGTEITDRLISIERVTGTRYNDIFTASDNGNMFTGGDGDDTFIGGAGQDILDGGDGKDTFTGNDNTDRFFISDPATSMSDADLITDFTDDEDFMYVGRSKIWYKHIDSDSAKGDTIIYADADGTQIIAILQNYNTALRGGEAGNFIKNSAPYDFSTITIIDLDTLDATATNTKQTHTGSADKNKDHVSYDSLTVPVTVDLLAGTAKFTPAGGSTITDTLISIEQVTGTDGNDHFTASHSGNTFTGGAGDDTFIGGTGDDTFIGGTGKDIFTGGGDDTGLVNVGRSATDVFFVNDIVNVESGDTAAAIAKADLITDFTDGEDLMHVGMPVGEGVLEIWHELIAYDADGTKDDTIIYADNAKTQIIAILQDYTTGLDGSLNGDFIDDSFEPLEITITDIT